MPYEHEYMLSCAIREKQANTITTVGSCGSISSGDDSSFEILQLMFVAGRDTIRHRIELCKGSSHKFALLACSANMQKMALLRKFCLHDSLTYRARRMCLSMTKRLVKHRRIAALL